MQPCLNPGLEASEACGGWLRLWDVCMVAVAAGQTRGEQGRCGELPAFSLRFSLRGPFPIPVSSFFPERVEAILSGWQSLSKRAQG